MLNKIKIGMAAMALSLGLFASTAPIEALTIGEIQEKGELIAVVPSVFNVDGVLFEHNTEIIFTETMRTRKQKMERIVF